MNNPIGFNLGAAIGIEKRKQLADRLTFLHGFEPFLNVGMVFAGDNNLIALGGGVGCVIGFQYELSGHFYIALETIPSLSISVTGNGGRTVFSSTAGFNSNALAITGVYRFEKQ